MKQRDDVIQTHGRPIRHLTHRHGWLLLVLLASLLVLAGGMLAGYAALAGGMLAGYAALSTA